DSAQASWHHARLVVTSDSVTIEDLQSKNGTMVNSTWIVAPTRLSAGDELQMGTVRFVLRTGEKPVETATRDAG
ncbi:MAG: FHA domain-containing protein, partial [Vicinamibacterales bacterium]